LAGPIGGAIASATKNNVVDGVASVIDGKEFEASSKEEYKRTLYTEKENPNKASVFIVYLDAEVDGKRVFVKTMTPTKLPEGKNPHIAAVETAIAYFLQQY
jgi:Cu2+-containing amine oxidase